MASARPSPPRRAPDSRGASTAAARDGQDAAGRIAWLCFLLILVVVPLAVTRFELRGGQLLQLTIDPVDIAKVFLLRALALITLAAWALSVHRNGGRVRVGRIDGVLAVFLLWVTLTSLLSIDRATSVLGSYARYEGLISFIFYYAVFFLTRQLVSSSERLRSAARALVLGGTLVAIYAATQFLGVDPLRWSNVHWEAHRAFATFGNPDLLGGYLIFPLAVCLPLALTATGRRSQAAYWLGFSLLITALLATFVRGAWLGGIAALASLGVASYRQHIRLGRRGWALAGAAAAVAALFAWWSATSKDAVTNILTRAASIFEATGGMRERLLLWRAALAAAATRPLFGYGPDTYRLFFQWHRPSGFATSVTSRPFPDNAHSYPLQLASTLGFPGLILLYTTFGWALVRSAPAAFSTRPSRDRMLLAGFWAAALGYLVHLSFGISVVGSSVFLWFALAVLTLPFSKPVAVPAGRVSALAVAAVLVIVVAASAANIAFVLADHYGQEALVSRDFQAGVASSRVAARLDPFNVRYTLDEAATYESRLYELAARVNASPNAVGNRATRTAAMAALEGAVGAYRRAIRLQPFGVDGYAALANLYNRARLWVGPAYGPQALAAADQGLRISPQDPLLRWEDALALAGLGLDSQATEQLDQVVSLDPAFVPAWIMRGDLDVRAGDVVGAEKAYREALRLEPGNPEVRRKLASLETSPGATGTH